MKPTDEQIAEVIKRFPGWCPESIARWHLDELAKLAMPDIGKDPLKYRDEVDSSPEAAQARLSKIYCVQQAGVPDQTCLVWRIDVDRVCCELIWRRAGWHSWKKSCEEAREEAKTVKAQLARLRKKVKQSKEK